MYLNKCKHCLLYKCQADFNIGHHKDGDLVVVYPWTHGISIVTTVYFGSVYYSVILLNTNND